MLRPHLTYAVLAVWNWSLLQAIFRQSRSSNGKMLGHCVIVSCNVHLRNINDLPSKTQTSQIRKGVLRTNSIKIIINTIIIIIIFNSNIRFIPTFQFGLSLGSNPKNPKKLGWDYLFLNVPLTPLLPLFWSRSCITGKLHLSTWSLSCCLLIIFYGSFL